MGELSAPRTDVTGLRGLDHDEEDTAWMERAVGSMRARKLNPDAGLEHRRLHSPH